MCFLSLLYEILILLCLYHYPLFVDIPNQIRFYSLTKFDTIHTFEVKSLKYLLYMCVCFSLFVSEN